MSQGTACMKVPMALAGLWLLTASVSVLAVPLIIATVPGWHTITRYLQMVSGVQTWVSIAACVVLLMLSRRKHSESEEEWAQGAILIYVLGGVISAVLLNYGVFPQWLAKSASLVKQAQVLALMLLHWCCAWCTWRSLRRHCPQA
ncbi:hypothetical protein D3C78_207890 [compost metagenome]